MPALALSEPLEVTIKWKDGKQYGLLFNSTSDREVRVGHTRPFNITSGYPPSLFPCGPHAPF